MAEVQVSETRSFRASEVVQVAEGETQVVINLPEPVPAGKVLNLRVEVSGSYGEAAEPVVRAEPVA